MAAATVVIVADNDFVESRLLANVMVLQRHSLLRTTLAEINALRAACGTCSGKKVQATEEIRSKWNVIRQYLAELPQTDRDQIREAAQIRPNQRVRIAYAVGSGQNTTTQRRDF